MYTMEHVDMVEGEANKTHPHHHDHDTLDLNMLKICGPVGFVE